MSDDAQLRQARALFRSFHNKEPRAGQIIRVVPPTAHVIGLEVGTLLSIGYKAAGNGESFYHEFEATMPKLYVSQGGRQIIVVGGSYRFTDRGFIK